MRIHAFHRLYQQRLNQSTKTFNARGSKVIRCQYCQVAADNCICRFQPDIELDVAVLLLVSENEVFKPSNTGRLIADVVKECAVFQWDRTEPAPEMLQLITDQRYQPMVIFPSEYVAQSERLVSLPLSIGQGKTPLLIFIDGSWREARRIFRKSPYLDTIPVLSITPQTLSQYVMRRSDNDQHLATAEVASAVLEQLGHVDGAMILRYWFDAFRESYLMSKSRLKVNRERNALKYYINEYHSTQSLGALSNEKLDNTAQNMVSVTLPHS
jgi:DTW domain-containing protein YfiP